MAQVVVNMGRRARPVELLVLGGKHKRSKRQITARQQVEAALRPPADKLEPPHWLDDEARAVFLAVVAAFDQAGLRVLTNADVNTLAVYADAVARYVEASRLVREQGPVAGNKPHPAVLAAAKYAQIMHQAGGRLGLDPASRATLAKAAAEQAAPDEFDRLFGQREE